MKTIIKIIVAIIVAIGVALWADAYGIGYRYGFVSVYLFCSVGVYYALDAIDVRMKRRQSRFDSIKDASRSLKQAA